MSINLSAIDGVGLLRPGGFSGLRLVGLDVSHAQTAR